MGAASFDRLDVRILRGLNQNPAHAPGHLGPRAPYREVARRLRVAPGVVRERILRMRRSGVMTGTSVFPNPNLLRLRSGACVLDLPPSTKQEAVRELVDREGTLFVHDFHGPMAGLAFVVPEDDTLDGWVSRACARTGATAWGTTEMPYPPCNVTLTRLDRSILARLTQSGFSGYAELAQATHTSSRTVRRRVARLVRGSAVFSIATIDYRAIDGGIPADLQVVYASARHRLAEEERILQRLEPYLVFVGLWPGFALYSMVLPKVSLLTELASRVQAVPGVVEVRSGFVDRHIDRASRLADYLGSGTKAALPPLSVAPTVRAAKRLRYDPAAKLEGPIA